MIKFSVITCTYNASAVLARTLDSVLSQSWTQIEHIIIDGASKDNTLAMAQAYSLKNQEEETEHEVVIVSEPDRGLYDAMNKGLARATGDYTVYLNAGDVFPSAHTLEQISINVNNRSDGKLPAVLYGDTNIVDDEGRLLRPALPLLCRCRLVHTHHEASRARASGIAASATGGGQLSRWRHDQQEPSSLAH